MEINTRVSSYLGLVSWCTCISDFMLTLRLEPSIFRFKRQSQYTLCSSGRFYLGSRSFILCIGAVTSSPIYGEFTELKKLSTIRTYSSLWKWSRAWSRYSSMIVDDSRFVLVKDWNLRGRSLDSSPSISCDILVSFVLWMSVDVKCLSYMKAYHRCFVLLFFYNSNDYPSQVNAVHIEMQ